jgi:hypothetical protein
LAHAFLREYRYKRLKLAQFLGQNLASFSLEAQLEVDEKALAPSGAGVLAAQEEVVGHLLPRVVCPGRKSPFLIVKRPARPKKNHHTESIY